MNHSKYGSSHWRSVRCQGNEKGHRRGSFSELAVSPRNICEGYSSGGTTPNPVLKRRHDVSGGRRMNSLYSTETQDSLYDRRRTLDRKHLNPSSRKKSSNSSPVRKSLSHVETDPILSSHSLTETVSLVSQRSMPSGEARSPVIPRTRLRCSPPTKRNNLDKNGHDISLINKGSTVSFEPPRLTKEIAGFNFHSSRRNVYRRTNKSCKGGAKINFMDKVSCLSLIGGCKKRTPKSCTKSRRSKSSTRKITFVSVGMNTHDVDDDSGTEEKSDCSNSYISASSSDMNDYPHFTDSSDFERDSYDSCISCTTSSFVEDEFLTDDDFSVTEDLRDDNLNSRIFTTTSESSSDLLAFQKKSKESEGDCNYSHASCTSVQVDDYSTSDHSTWTDDDANEEELNHQANESLNESSRKLFATLKAENQSLRKTVLTLRDDWKAIVKQINNLQDDGKLLSDTSDVSTKLQVINKLRNQAMNTFRKGAAIDELFLNSATDEGNRNAFIKCVEGLLCENERLYSRVIFLSQEREDILKLLSSMQTMSKMSLDKGNISGMSFSTEQVAILHQKYMDGILLLLAQLQDLACESHRDRMSIMGNEVMKLVSKIMSQRIDSKSETIISNKRKSTPSNGLIDQRMLSEDSALNFDESSSCTTASKGSTDKSLNSIYTTVLNIDDMMSSCNSSVKSSVLPSISAVSDDDSETLEIIYDYYYSSELELSSDCIKKSPRLCSKKNFFRAIHRIGDRIRKTNKFSETRGNIIDEAKIYQDSRLLTDLSVQSDIEPTYYPEYSPSTSRSSSSKTNMASHNSQPQKSSVIKASSYSFSIKENETPLNKDSSQFPVPIDEDTTQSEESIVIESESDSSDQISDNISFGKDDLREDVLGTDDSNETDHNVSIVPCQSIRETFHSSVSKVTTLNDEETQESSSSMSTKERKGISITVISRSSSLVCFPSSRSHTYMTFFAASLVKSQVDALLQEQLQESLAEIHGTYSLSTLNISSHTKKKKYHGDFNEEGQRHGYGIYISKNGNEYRGEWMHDKRAGLGIVRIGNGDVFEGQFENNLKNGIGVYHYIDGECDLSLYKDDHRIGYSLRWTKDRLDVFIISADVCSKMITLHEAADIALKMGVVIQT